MAADALNPTGALSALLFILALSATPMRQRWPTGRVALWLVHHRRYLGVASFGYALLHTLLYLLDAGSMAKIIAGFSRLDYLSGWIAALIMVPLALTSNNRSTRWLGKRWKALQRWAYGAALLGLFHAISLDDWRDPWAALVISAPLILMQLSRLHCHIVRQRRRAATDCPSEPGMGRFPRDEGNG